MTTFGDKVTLRTRALGHPLCVGLDPYVDLIPSAFRCGSEASTVLNFLTEFLGVANERTAIVKPQISLFERMGTAGIDVLGAVIEKARSLGLLVLLDDKRGDIGATARGYAEAYLRPNAHLEVDAVTVNPYMGLDAIEPFVELAEANDKGVIVLVRNSNPGSDIFQKLSIEGTFLYERVAESLHIFQDRLLGETGWSSLGVTVSARSPEDSVRIRSYLPAALFLSLGYGAQGADAASSLAGFAVGPSGYEGGIVNSSRAVLYPEADRGTWEARITRSIDKAIAGLRASVHPE